MYPQRAIRRHHTARLKRNRQNYWGYHRTSPMSQAGLGKVSQYPCACSCFMCGNPRKHFKDGRSIQEQSFDQPKFHSEG